MKKYKQIALLLPILISGCSNKFNTIESPSSPPLIACPSLYNECYTLPPKPLKLIKDNFSVKVFDENDKPITDAKVIVNIDIGGSRPYPEYAAQEKSQADSDGSYKFEGAFSDDYPYSNIHVKVSKGNWTSYKDFYMRLHSEETKLLNFSRPTGKVIYDLSDKQNNTSELYIINLDGSSKIKLSEDSVNTIKPVLSSDNKTIAYLSQKDGKNSLFTVNIDGSNRRELYNNVKDSWVSWSADNKKILFEGLSDNGISYISIINSDGTNLTQITDLSESIHDPSLSPDGKKIVYVMEKNNESSLCLMNVDGSNKEILNYNAGYNYFKLPQWSLDSKKLAYLDINNRAFTTNAEKNSNNNVIAENVNGIPKWAPDSSRVIFSQSWSLDSKSTGFTSNEPDVFNISNDYLSTNKFYLDGITNKSTAIWIGK